VILDLSKNLLSGEIPSSLGNLLKLERLNLSSNQLQGEVPPSLGKLTSLHMLNLSNNHLRGQLPSTLPGIFPLSSFLGNAKLCGPPLAMCSESVGQEKKQLSETEVVGIIVAIVFTSTVICLVMLYIMWRIWCQWREVSISSADGGGIEEKREEGKRVIYGDEKTRRNGEYWKVNSMALVSSQDKPNSTILARIFHLRMDSEAMENTLY
jgi:Leucine-rich repeat (LRR) protein